jgi:hypothetical protein
MKALPTNIGADPKKLALLGVIVLGGAGLVYWANSGSDGPPQDASAPSSPGTTVSLNRMPNLPPDGAPPKASSGALPGAKAPTRSGSTRVEDFRPSIKLPEGMDVSRIDPRLKTELLARLRALPDEGGARSVFEFYVPPPPPPPVQPIKPAPVAVAAPPPGPIAPAAPPPPPPITIKLFALVGQPGKERKVFFLDGEDSFMVAENDMIRGRYKIIHLGVLDAEVEDTVTKHRETIKIVPEIDP